MIRAISNPVRPTVLRIVQKCYGQVCNEGIFEKISEGDTE